MTSQHWWAFALTTFIICFTPGPNMLHMMRSGAQYGLRHTLFSMAGCFMAVISMIGISLAGIGALLKASPLLFMLLRYAGAAYLFYMGLQAWRQPSSLSIDAPHAANLNAHHSAKSLFRGGFLIGISNPKAMLFAGAFFPQFIDPALPQAPQLLVLLLTFAVLEISCYSAYALGGRSIGGILKHASVRRAFNRFTGTIFAGFGVLLIVKSV